MTTTYTSDSRTDQPAPTDTDLDVDQMCRLLASSGYTKALGLITNPLCSAQHLSLWAQAVCLMPSYRGHRHSKRATRALGRVAHAIAHHNNVPPEALTQMVKSPRSQIRQAALSSPSLPQEVWDHRISSPFREPRDLHGIINNPRMTDPTVAMAWVEANPKTRRAVLAGPTCPAELIRQVLAGENRKELKALATGASCQGHLLWELSRHPAMEIRRCVAIRPDCPVAILVVLAHDDAPEVRQAVVSHRNTPVGQLKTLAVDPDDGVRSRLASYRADLPLSVLRILAKDSEVEVRRWVAERPQCDTGLLWSLSESFERFPQHLLPIIAHPNCSIQLLTELAGSVHSEVRAKVAAHPDCPEYIRAVLALGRD